MALPNQITIVPLREAVSARVTIPGSKSITNRALILAVLSQGKVVLEGALWSEDTQIMVECLHRLGFSVRVEPDTDEPCNRKILVDGLGGRIPKAGTHDKPLDLYVGNAGTVARFIGALVCLGRGVYRLRGVDRMHERPQAALFHGLRQLGYHVDAPKDRLPAVLIGAGPRSGKVAVPIEESSQFASALALCSRVAGWDVHVSGQNAGESPYFWMTKELIEQFPHHGGKFLIEPDASSGSYFWAVNPLVLSLGKPAHMAGLPGTSNESGNSKREVPIAVNHWPKTNWQIDRQFPSYVPLPTVLSREHHLGDSIMTAMIVAANLDPNTDRREWTHFEQLGRLRLQECDRVSAMHAELRKCGATVVEEGDTLRIAPSAQQMMGAEIETYNDHRMAMCFAILGLKVPGIKINNPTCVRKTFPNFFQKLSAPAPDGLGVTILETRTGRRLEADTLLAE